MANKIRLKRGIHQNLPPDLEVGEPAFTTDTHKLYIGSADGNIEITKEKITKTDVNNESEFGRIISGKFVKEEILDKIDGALDNVKIDDDTIKRDGQGKMYVNEITQAKVAGLPGALSGKLNSGLGVIRDLNITDETYIISWKTEDGTKKSFDLPIETMPLTVTFDKTTGELVITTEGGSITRVDIGHLVEDVVLKVNGKLPNAQGEVTIAVTDIAGLETRLSGIEGSVSTVGGDLTAHINTKIGNPHKVTKADVELGNVENKSSETIRSEIVAANIPTLAASKIGSGIFNYARIPKADKAEAEAGAIDTKYMTPLRTKNAFDEFISGVTIDGGEW